MSEDERSELGRLARQTTERAIRAVTRSTARWRPPPEFIVIGGKRCGSTSLYYGLLQHPSVIPMIPSARWLPMREHRKGARWLDRADADDRGYRAHFVTAWTRHRVARRSGAAVTGEATPWYLFAPGAAAVAGRLAPDARLIVVLRDPVLRAFSHFREQRRRGHEPLEDFGAALAAEADRVESGLRLADGSSRSPAFAREHLTYRGQGEYDRALSVWRNHFDDDRFVIVTSEAFYADSASVLRDVATRLGLPAHDFRAEHRNPTSGPEIDARTATELSDHYRPGIARLEDLLGRSTGWL